MKRFFTLCLALSLATVFMAGCEEKAKTQRTETTTSPGGKTTVTDEHTVKQSGDNPPPSSTGEQVK